MCPHATLPRVPLLLSCLPHLLLPSAGDAGTGKSFLLNRIIAELREEYGEDFGSAVGVTAATGAVGGR